MKCWLTKIAGVMLLAMAALAVGCSRFGFLRKAGHG